MTPIKPVADPHVCRILAAARAALPTEETYAMLAAVPTPAQKPYKCATCCDSGIVGHSLLCPECNGAPAQAEPASPWVAVSERLPNVAQEVIIFSDFEGVCAGVLDSYDEWFAPCSEYKLTRVTHWMPLPAAPAIAAARKGE